MKHARYRCILVAALSLALGGCTATALEDLPAPASPPFPAPASCAATPLPAPASEHGYPASWLHHNGMGLGIGQGVLYEGVNAVAWHEVASATARLGDGPAIPLSTVGHSRTKTAITTIWFPEPGCWRVEAERDSGGRSGAGRFTATVYVYPGGCPGARRDPAVGTPPRACVPPDERGAEQ